MCMVHAIDKAKSKLNAHQFTYKVVAAAAVVAVARFQTYRFTSYTTGVGHGFVRAESV